MKRINIIGYSIKQGLKSLRKNRMFTLASIGTVAACLFLFGLFYFVLSNFRYVVQTAESSVGISVFFDESITAEGIQMIGDAIESRPEVDHIEYISAEQAWENFKKENFNESQDLIASFGEDNPLQDSASYEVYVKKIEEQDSLVEYLETISGVRDVKRSTEVAGGLSSVSNLVGVGSATLILVLLLVSVFLIHSTISTGITVRKPEIAIMRLMGASDFFIWGPFILEGIVIGFIGAALPLVILAVLYGRIIEYVMNRFAMFTENLSFLSTGHIFASLIPISLLLGVGIGFLGSYITVRRNLNV